MPSAQTPQALGKEMDEMKICTYNVHMWTDARHEPNIYRVANLISELQPDVLCLQEATGSEELELIKTECGFLNLHKFNGLAVLTKMPSTFLMGSGDDPNGFLLCRLELGSGQRLLLVNLHPDCEDEDTRMQEFKAWEEKAEKTLSKESPQLWLGDFNALTREDYTQKQWDEITAERAKSYWEEPRTELMDQLRAKGLADSWARVGRPGKVSTCRFATHIDYILMNEAFMEGWLCTSVDHLLLRHQTTRLLWQHIKENSLMSLFVHIVSVISKHCF